MLRLSPERNMYLEQAHSLDINFGGAESNVASNMARLGLHSCWYSRLPDNPIGHACVRDLRGHGVDTHLVDWSPDERMGVYYIQYGEDPRGIRVWYDRANSAASHISPETLPLAEIGETRWLHLTGITPALSESCRAAVAAALDYATEHDVSTSFDVNYRALLWDTATAAAVLDPFCKQADVVFVALRDAVNLWGVPDNIRGALDALHEKWGGIIILTSGDQGAWAYDGSERYQAESVPVTIVDRIGAGDAFASGTLFGLLNDKPIQEAMAYGTSLAALALTTLGDMVFATREDLESLVTGRGGALRR